MDNLNMEQMVNATIPPPALPSEFPAPIPQVEQDELTRKLTYELDEFDSSTSGLRERVARYHKLYDIGLADAAPKTFPWPGAANYNVPLIMSVVDSMHARIAKAVFDVDPIWLARARTPEGSSTAKKAEWYLDYWADRMQLPAKLDMTGHLMLIEGTSVVKLDWEEHARAIPQPPPVVPGQFQVPEDAKVVEYAGPSVYPIPLKDFVLIPADSPTIDDATYVGHRVTLTTVQLRARQESGVYFNVDELIERAATTTTTRTPNENTSKLVNVDSNSNYEETQQYEVVEIYGPYDFGSGPELSVMTFNPDHDILLRLEPSTYGYNRPPYVSFTAYPRPNFFYGRSIPELLESSQDELTALHNMRSDSLTRRIAPPLMQQVGSAWNPDEIPWKPGQVIPFNDPGELFELQLSDIPNGLFAHEQDIMQFTERVTGMSDYAIGTSPSRGRTATEVNRVTSEGLARIDVIISRFQQGMRQIAWHLWWMLYQYRPYWDYFYAENTAMSITKPEMRPAPNGMVPFEFIPQGQLSDASKEARRQQNLMLLQVTAPYLQQFYPDGLQYLLDRTMAEFDIQDRSNILGPSWNLLQEMLQQAQQAGYQAGIEAANAATE
jgi:hypothetical protein